MAYIQVYPHRSHLKMPQYHANKSGSGGAAKKRKDRNQFRNTRNAIEDQEAIVGKVTKSLGFQRFMVAITKDKEVNVRIQGNGRNVKFITPGDYVILSQDFTNKDTTYEIICPIADKDMKAFKKRISSGLMDTEVDDIFIRPEPKEESEDEIDFTNI